jgi:hypothetical protein
VTVTLGETIRIEAETRWDAIDLARRLDEHHTYLVQLGDKRWHVCVRADDADLELPAVQAAAQRWAEERHVEGVLRCGGRTIALPA